LPDSGAPITQRLVCKRRVAGSTDFLTLEGRKMMNKKMLSAFLVAAVSFVAPVSAASAQGIPAGWSVDTKPKRAILTFAPEANGPRHLIVACLRDSDEIGIYSTGVGAPSGKPVVMLSMTNSGRRYSVRGEMGMDNITNQPAFRYETNIDSRALSIFRAEFLPILNGKGPLKLTIGEKSQDVPLAGVAEPLKKFNAACFGRS
jgi:hypothetical protein